MRDIFSRTAEHSTGRSRLDLMWLVLLVVNLAAIAAWPAWATVPFHLSAIAFIALYGFRIWPTDPLLWGFGIVLITTLTGIVVDVLIEVNVGSSQEALDIPLLATMFVAVVWHANRRISAEHERQVMGEKNARLLTAQRRFLQDASHHLRTPITIALTHSELLARGLTHGQERNDVQVVLAELNRLRRLSERLLVIAGAEDPDFLRSEPVALEDFVMDVIERWRSAAQRGWKLGRLDAVTVLGDEERLGLAVDALVENAVKYTSADDIIELSVISDRPGEARIIVADTGKGVSSGDLEHVFERFRRGSNVAGTKGTGLGLAVVRAVADAHGGSAQARSRFGEGSEFEISLPSVTD